MRRVFIVLGIGAVLVLIGALFLVPGGHYNRPQMAAQGVLRDLVRAEERYFAENGEYTDSIIPEKHPSQADVSVVELRATATSWYAVARHPRWTGKSCVVWGGDLPPAQRPATESTRKTFPPHDIACDDIGRTPEERWALAYVNRMPALLSRFGAQQERHFGKHVKYASSLAALAFTPDSAFAITWTYASDSGWVVEATHPDAPGGRCAMWTGAVPPASRPRVTFYLDNWKREVHIEDAEESVAECRLPGQHLSHGPVAFYDRVLANTGARLWMLRDLHALVRAQTAHAARHGGFASAPSALGDFQPSAGVTIEQFSRTADGWRATARHTDLAGESCVVWGGTLAPSERPATQLERRTYPGGVPACDGDRRTVESATTIARLDSAEAMLRRLVRLQERYVARYGRYAQKLLRLVLSPDSAIHVEFVPQNRDAWAAKAWHVERPDRLCLAWGGNTRQSDLRRVPSLAWPDIPGEVWCDDYETFVLDRNSRYY